jgi:hypothetical protein
MIAIASQPNTVCLNLGRPIMACVKPGAVATPPHPTPHLDHQLLVIPVLGEGGGPVGHHIVEHVLRGARVYTCKRLIGSAMGATDNQRTW